MLYTAAFDLDDPDAGYGTLTLATSGKPSIVITLGSLAGGDGLKRTLHHYQQSNVTPLQWYSEDSAAELRATEVSTHVFRTILYSAFSAGATAQGWVSPSSFSVGFSRTTGLYSYSYLTANFSMTWSTAAGRALCGVSANKSGSTSYSGDVVPPFVIVPTLIATSDSTPNYERTGIASQAIPDNGAVGPGISREVAALYRTWVQQFENRAKTLRGSEASTHPETFERFRQYCRTVYPFVVVDGFGDTLDEMFYFTKESASWSAGNDLRASRANNAQFHIPHDAVVVGRQAA